MAAVGLSVGHPTSSVESAVSSSSLPVSAREKDENNEEDNNEQSGALPSGGFVSAGACPGASPIPRVTPSHDEVSTASSRDLPSYTEACDTKFTWGDLEGPDFSQAVNSAYAEVAHWRRNICQVPSGEAGKEFVLELAKLFNAYGEGSALESVALTAAMILPVLLLQKPYPQSKAKDHVFCLKRRMKSWQSGDIDGLVREGRVIQQHLETASSTIRHDSGTLRGFTRLMLLGNVRGALRVLSNSTSGGVLPLSATLVDSDGLTKSVRDILEDKHPEPGPAVEEALLQNEHASQSPGTYSVLFEGLSGDLIRRAALRTEGSAGPSAIDASGWRRLCTAFHAASTSLCNSVAGVTRRLCTSYVDPSCLHALFSCRLIPLDKRPGVRPIGVCETVRRIMGKAVMSIVGKYVRLAAGPLQMCAGQPAGSEAAIHAMSEIFNDSGSDAVLLVDAKNAFNCLNRRTALHNIQVLCPVIAPYLINTYRCNSMLFVGGDVMQSMEGTTQGDPLAMAMYAIAIRPLIDRIARTSTLQVWFADDAAGGGKIQCLRKWWDLLNLYGPSYGYFVNASKTWLLVKPEALSEAESAFSDTNINITTNGVRHLGAPLGDRDYTTEVLKAQVEKWTAELTVLSEMARTQPHLAYCALTQGMVGKWVYLSRTVPGISDLLQPLEDVLRKAILPAITGRNPPNDVERELFTLPVKLGGLGIMKPPDLPECEFDISNKVSAPLVALIVNQHRSDTGPSLSESLCSQKAITTAQRKEKHVKVLSKSNGIQEQLTPSLQYMVSLAQEHGASTWLSARPVEEHGFALHKGAFRDALALRYGWEPALLPSHCACGKAFSSEHALSCPTGGFLIVRHNEVRDFTAGLLREICHDVEIEPTLQPLTGEQLVLATANRNIEARLDIKARGLWGGRFECAFFDVRVFNPCARSNQTPGVTSAYRRHEAAKRRQYEQRVRDVEMASFVPLVFNTSGGLAPAATVTYKRLAMLLSEKWAMQYSAVMGWLRCRISFALLRASIMCLRGSRRHIRSAAVGRPELALAEARLT